MRNLLRRLLIPAVVAAALVSPAVARAEGLEVSDVRTDNFPRVIVRFSASEPDGTPISNIKPGQVQVWENGKAQDQVDFFSLRESSPELWVSLVMDISGSMNDENKLTEAKNAARAFTSRLRAKDRTSIVTFSDKVVLQQQPTGDPGVLRRAIDDLKANGPTRMNDGLARGVAEALRSREGARRAIILISDGEDTGSETSLEAAVTPAREAKVPVYVIGLGTDVKTDILSGIATETKGRYYAAPRASDLDYVFRLLSSQLSSNYEAWWQSVAELPSGSAVKGRLVLETPGGRPVEASFEYVVPVFFKPPVRPEAAPVSGELPREVDLGVATGWELPDWWPLAAAALGALGVYVAFYGLILRLTRTRVQERLQNYVVSAESPANRAAQANAARKSVRPMVMRLARLSYRLTPMRVLDDLRHKLVLAGRPSSWHFSQFLATKILVALGLAVTGYVLSAAGSAAPQVYFAVIAAVAMIGFYLPHLWLSRQIKGRQKAISRALPDALDLITVGVGAGLSLDGAILEVAQKSDNELSRELANFLAELRMGRSRREALQGLQIRTEVDDLKVLVASLIQAEELGMSLSDTLMVQADQMRQRRRQRAEELAHKATVKMMFPMIMLIFPALFVVIMGPAVPGMLNFVRGGGA